MEETNVVNTARDSQGIEAASSHKRISPVDPMDSVGIVPTMIYFDYRVYEEQVSMYKASIAKAEELYRRERQNTADYYDAWQKTQKELDSQVQDARQLFQVLAKAGIKLVPNPHNKGYRVVILKRKPKK